MSRGGRSKKQAGQPPEHQAGSLRTCIGCRRTRPPRELLRLAVAPEGVVVDRRRRVPGRGAWVCRDEACAARAVRHLARALRLPRVAATGAQLQQLVAGQTSVLGGPGPGETVPGEAPRPGG